VDVDVIVIRARTSAAARRISAIEATFDPSPFCPLYGPAARCKPTEVQRYSDTKRKLSGRTCSKLPRCVLDGKENARPEPKAKLLPAGVSGLN
jgi:hypothetical protein